jgi:hypothetical protein
MEGKLESSFVFDIKGKSHLSNFVAGLSYFVTYKFNILSSCY